MISNSPKLKVVNGHAYATSLSISKNFRKRHKDVLEAIENAANEPKNQPVDRSEIDFIKSFINQNCQPSTYRDEKGETRRMYLLSRDAFAFVVMGFTGFKAKTWKIRYINAFNELESELLRRQIKDREFGQLKFHFPEAAETLEETLPSFSVSYAVARLAELGLMIPPVTRGQIISLIKRGTLGGFKNDREWCIYEESFKRFVKLRSGQLV